MAAPPDIHAYPAEHRHVEYSFIGALLQSNAAAVLKDTGVHIADLVDPISRWCWRAMRLAAAAGCDPDALVLTSAARDAGLAAPPAWRSAPLTELSRIRDQGPPPAAVDHFAELVVENAERRRIHQLGQLVTSRAYVAPIGELRALVAELRKDTAA